MIAIVAPVLFHLVHADLLVLAVALVAIASLLRGPELMLDRLFVATIMLLGGLLTAGLLFSLWPWGLDPIPVGWFLLLTIAAVSYFTRRQPQLPLVFEASDAILLGSGGLAFWAVYRPLRGLDAVQRLTFNTTNLDRMAHFALFNTVRRLGSYAFLDQKPARVSVQTPTEIVYPQGSHFLLALVETFTRGGSTRGSGVAELDRYFVLVLAGYALLITAVVWAARWIAGRAVGAFGRVLVCVVAAAFALLGPLAALIQIGADSQIFGLVAVALTTAIVVRPLRDDREQLIAAAAIVVFAFYTYNPYGPLVVLGIAFSFALHRFPLWRERRAVLTVGLPAAAVALLPSALTFTSSLDVQKQALIAGTRIPISNWLVVLLAVLAATPLLLSPRAVGVLRRGYAAQLGAVVLVVGGFTILQDRNSGTNSYYLAKLVGGAYVALLPCLGMLGLLLVRGTHARAERAEFDHRAVTPTSCWSVPALAAVATAILLIGSTAQHRLPGTAVKTGQPTFVPLTRWSDGEDRNAAGPIYIGLARAGQLGDGVPTLVVVSANVALNKGVSFLVASLNGDLGDMKPVFVAFSTPIRDFKGQPIPGQDPQSIIAAAKVAHRQLRVIAPSAAYAATLNRALIGHGVQVNVVVNTAMVPH